MRPGDMELCDTINERLTEFNEIRPMPGIDTAAARNCFIEQIVDSVRRIKYVTVVKNKNHTVQVADATNSAFDPIKAAALKRQQGALNEAYWLVFLSIHFGKNLRTNWNLVRDVYGALGQASHWNWATISADIAGFRNWLNDNEETLKQRGKFGNHRKYESLNAFRQTGTGEAFESYIAWIGDGADHVAKFNTTLNEVDNDPRAAFSALYSSMADVKRFGRTARFDYLTMIGKLGLIEIEPDSTYMVGATGPFSGAKLLFGVDANRATLDTWLAELEAHLGLYYGMQVLEDAICNWQKSPNKYIHFGG